MRSALRRQPASVRFGEHNRFDLERPADGGVLKTLPVSDRSAAEILGKISQESSVNSKKIPVFRRRILETRFDLHCVMNSVHLCKILLSAPTHAFI